MGRHKKIKVNAEEAKTTKEKPRKVKEMTDEGAARLAAAIVEAAVNDYRDAAKAIKKLKWKARTHQIPRDRNYNDKLSRLRGQVYINKKFFFSKTCSLLSSLDPNWIVETLDKEVEEYDPSRSSK